MALTTAACGSSATEAPDRDDIADAARERDGPSRAATFSAIYREVFAEGRCTLGLCHGEGASGGGLDLDPVEGGYANLVGAPSTSSDCRALALPLVEAGSPEQSLLLLKLDFEHPPCGLPMPPDRPLSAEAIDQVRRWIERGAPND